MLAKSPLTDMFGESDCGGAFGYHMRKAGFDGIILLGKAPSPVYIASLTENRDSQRVLSLGKAHVRDGGVLLSWRENRPVLPV